MDWNAISNGFFAILLTGFGWLLKTIWEAVVTLRKDLVDMQVRIADLYVRKDDLREMMADLKNHLIRIEAKLSEKVDK